jgi:hypothetical protein
MSTSLKFYSEVKAIRGYASSLIYDMGRSNVTRITNDVFDFLSPCARYLIDDIDQELKTYLVENEFVYEYDDFDESHIQEIQLNTEFPSLLRLVYLNTTELLNLNFVKMINQTLPSILIIRVSTIHNSYEYLILEIVNSFFIDRIVFLIEINESNHVSFFENLCSKYNHIFISKLYENDTKHSNYNFSNFFNYRLKAENDFTFSLVNFIESHSHNLFFNGLIFIDTIIEKPEENYAFSLFLDKNDSMTDIVTKHISQLKYISLSKSCKLITDVCKDCEFRHMCVDNRLPHQRAENEWYHQTECNYNPYIAKWQGEEGYRTLAECGVISNEHEFSIDHEKIALINKELWGDE